jgi:CheY-like chemotaxis protein
MTQEVQQRVFEPFYTTKPEGTGLGLATVFGIAQQNGGCVQISSRAGHGTRVDVFWCVATGTPEPNRFGGADIKHGTETILLVEDEETVRRLAATSLRSHGYRVMEAADGKRALDILEEEAFDLLITDVVMPQMGGWELVQKAKSARPDLSVLFVSGYAGSRLGEGDERRTFEPLLQKPYTIRKLLATVRDLLDR